MSDLGLTLKDLLKHAAVHLFDFVYQEVIIPIFED